MKKAFMIIGGLALTLVALITGLAWYHVNSNEEEARARQTEPARAARAANAKKKIEEEPTKETPDEN